MSLIYLKFGGIRPLSESSCTCITNTVTTHLKLNLEFSITTFKACLIKQSEIFGFEVSGGSRRGSGGSDPPFRRPFLNIP